ncbi:MAG UNVERIFIED_CONTAM: hypothetical protein LVQ98_08480 [Rickettsiaceae bacterium]|jgi:hypothetical protein
MTITCERKGWSHPWEPEEKKIIFSYQEIKSNGWLYDEHWDTKRRLSKKNYYKQKFGGSHEAVKDEIVKRLNTGKGNIEMIRVNAEGNGELNNLGSRHYSWDSFLHFIDLDLGRDL